MCYPLNGVSLVNRYSHVSGFFIWRMLKGRGKECNLIVYVFRSSRFCTLDYFEQGIRIGNVNKGGRLERKFEEASDDGAKV